jgi:hypothetical protein
MRINPNGETQMNHQQGTRQHTYDRLVKVSVAGFLIQLLWSLIIGAITLGKWARASSWILVGLAVLLIIVASSKPFGRFLEAEASEPSLPARVFIINGLSLLLVGAFLLILLDSSPHVLTSVGNATEAIFEGGLLVLILLSLVANLIAFSLDRRAA